MARQCIAIALGISLLCIRCASASVAQNEIADETTGWRLVEVAAYQLPTRTPDGFPIQAFLPDDFIVNFGEGEGPRFASLSADAAMDPGGDGQLLHRLFLWLPEHAGGQYVSHRTYCHGRDGWVPLHGVQLYHSPGKLDLGLMRVVGEADDPMDLENRTYRVERFHLDDQQVEGTCPMEWPMPRSRYGAEFMFVPLDGPGEYESQFAFWTWTEGSFEETLNILDLEGGTVDQPCFMADWDWSVYHKLLAYDVESDMALWWERIPDADEYGFAFRSGDGSVTYRRLDEIGIDRSVLDEPAIFGESYPPGIGRLGWYTNRVDGIPAAYFLLAGAYYGIRMTPDRPEQGWLLWQQRLAVESGGCPDVGRLNPSPDVGPGDCWVLWDIRGNVQIVDLDTGSMVFTGKLETTEWVSLSGDEVSQGLLRIGEIDPEMPQEICWWDEGAWTLRVYHLMPPEG